VSKETKEKRSKILRLLSEKFLWKKH
jgi:hypothetical protein